MDTQINRRTLGKIGYLKRLDLYGTEKPYQITVRPKYVQDSDAQKTNIVIDPQLVKITDISNRRGDFSTDIQGFELATFPSSLSSDELQDLDEIESRYYAEAKDFLMRRYNAHRVFIFDTTVCSVYSSSKIVSVTQYRFDARSQAATRTLPSSRINRF